MMLDYCSIYSGNRQMYVACTCDCNYPPEEYNVLRHFFSADPREKNQTGEGQA